MTETMIEKSRFKHSAYRIMTLCALLFVSFTASGQIYRSHRSPFEGGDDYHFGYISGSVGYSMLQTSVPNAVPIGNLGGAVGIGYEFRNSGLWVNVGAQLSFHRSKLQMDPYDTRNESDQSPYTGKDTQDQPTVFHYNLTQTDEMKWNYIDIPILVGYYVRGFHIGAGFKVSYALHPKTHSYGSYTLSATNMTYNVTFVDMPDRGYTTYDFDSEKENRMNVSASVIGEVGYDLLSSAPTRSRVCNVLKLSFYIEYGLNNQLRNWETPSLRVEPIKGGDARYPIINPYLNTFARPTRTVPFYTGVKLTYMIGGSRTARSGFHHGCMCYN